MMKQLVSLASLKHALDDVVAASDTARLQLHLMSLEARQRTGQLGTSLGNLELRIDHGVHQALASAADKARQLARGVRESLSREPQLFGTLHVADVMSARVYSCFPSDTLNRAAELMWQGDCGAVPIIDGDGRLCGIISDRDICMAGYTNDVPLTRIAIGDVMSRHVRTCAADEPLERAIATMGEAEVRRLPVVDSERHLVGMLSLADVARGASLLGLHEAEALTFQLLRAVSKRRASSATVQQLAAE